MSPSEKDRAITNLAREVYEAFRTWDKRETGRELRPFSKIGKAEQEPFKRIAEILYDKRDREG